MHLFKLLVLSDGWDVVRLSSLKRPPTSLKFTRTVVGGETSPRRKSLAYSIPCEENFYPSLSLGGNVPIALALTVDFSPSFLLLLWQKHRHKPAEEALPFHFASEHYSTNYSERCWEFPLIKYVLSPTIPPQQGLVPVLFCFWLKLLGFYPGMQGVCQT